MSGHDGRSQRTRIARTDLDIRASWRNFAAAEQEGEHDDHAPTFRARLVVAGGERPEVFEGETGKGKGHAEMTALDALIGSKGAEAAVALFRSGLVYVEAAGKPCCVHCSTLLGFLGVRPLSGATTKTRNTMLAGGAWGLSALVKEFLSGPCHLTMDSINGLEASLRRDFDRLHL